MKTHENRALFSKALLKATTCLFLTAGVGMSPVFALPEASTSVMETVQQNQTISGRITDTSGEPVIGASVVVKGTTNGTITDFDGKFSLNAPPQGTLTISYIGYKKMEISINGQQTVNVTLKEDTEILDEVVVVGYGTQKKATLTGSVSSVSGEDIKKVSAANLSNTLAGKTAGIIANTRSGEPGEDGADILIRGKGTLGNTSPLIVVDGIADRSFSRLNPEDIESISVLKDASATAVYGVKGANGVILLTTKRGLEQKPEISFTANFGFKQPSAAPEWSDYVTSMKQYNRAQANDGNWGAMVPESTITAWENAYATGNYGPYNDVFPEVDWWKELVKNVGYEQAYNLNVRGGTKKMSLMMRQRTENYLKKQESQPEI